MLSCTKCGFNYTVYLGNVPMCYPYKGVIDIYQCDKCGMAMTYYRYFQG